MKRLLLAVLLLIGGPIAISFVSPILGAVAGICAGCVIGFEACERTSNWESDDK